LDTNTVSYVISGRSAAARSEFDRALRSEKVAISALTEAEVMFGLRKRLEAIRLRAAWEIFRAAVEVLPWDSREATAYSELRFGLRARIATLDVMDLLIASHAIAADAVLVSRDRAFLQVKDLVRIENWATDLN
jgi:tRNA(fMet)-specific endonuclease VapC